MILSSHLEAELLTNAVSSEQVFQQHLRAFFAIENNRNRVPGTLKNPA